MFAIQQLRAILSLNYNYLATLFESWSGIMKRAENSELKLPPLQTEFALWLHKESLRWLDASFCSDRMQAAHLALNPKTIERLNRELNICHKQKRVLEYSIERSRLNYAYDVKAYAVLTWIESIRQGQFGYFALPLEYLIRSHKEKCAEKRFNRLLRSEYQLAYVDAQINVIERMLQIQLIDPATVE